MCSKYQARAERTQIRDIKTQYFDALKDIGAKSNTILLPHSPSAVQDLFGQLRNTITTGALAAAKSEETV